MRKTRWHALATLVAMFQINSNDEVHLIRMSIKEEPKYYLHIEEEIDGIVVPRYITVCQGSLILGP